MASPQDSIRRVIEEEVLGPRLTDQRAYLASSVPDPLPVARADLLYLWDENHTEMLDFGMEVSPLGHRHQPLLATVQDHMRYYGHTALQGQHALRWPVSYAKSLSASFSGPGEARRVLFCEGEREAVQKAILLACHRTDRFGTLVLDTGWHNWLPDRTLISPSQWSRVDWGRYGALLLSVVDTAYHPVAGVREWIMAARAAGVPVIVDETLTGFGRTGTLWGQEHSGLVADLTVLGGPVGGGLPLGAVVGPPEFFGTPEMCDTGMLAGHPWSCAAGQYTLGAVHPGVLEHVVESAQVLSQALDGLVSQFPNRLLHHKGIGLMRGLCFADKDRAAAFPLAARSAGLHLAPAVGSVVRLAPALVSSTHEVTRGVDLMADVLMSWEDS